jgi:hypothetical protein
MPIHDWTRVCANRFHDFHLGWTIAIRNALNAGQLPPDHCAIIEQAVSRPGLEPEVKPIWEQPSPNEQERYACKTNRIVIYHKLVDVVAVIEIVSPGNKATCHALRAFARKAVEFLTAGAHLLVVDLLSLGPRDPQMIHQLIWEHLHDKSLTLPPDKPLTLAAYSAGTEIVAYVEPVAVGDPLPDMPVFLTADRYVQCPLEATYQTAWDQYPAVLKAALEAPPAS